MLGISECLKSTNRSNASKKPSSSKAILISRKFYSSPFGRDKICGSRSKNETCVSIKY